MKISNGSVLLISAMISTGVMAAVTTTVVDVPSRGATQRFLYVHPDAPAANIIVLPGGEGVLGIRDDGTMATLTAVCNPIVRNRQAFAGHGFALALVDATSTGSVWNFSDVLEVIRYMQGRDNVPTWLIGGSSSTAPIWDLAVNLPTDSPVGVIFFSPDRLAASLAARIMRPTLVIFHVEDPAQYGTALFNALTSAPVKEKVGLSGGSNAGQCGYHLFNGLDAAFVAATTGFIDNYNGTLTTSLALAVEFYNAEFDHYFLTHKVDEIALLDAGVTIKGWSRTGQSFNVYPAANSGTSPVCRFYIPPAAGNSHFYGRGSEECNRTQMDHPSFINEDPQFFHVVLPTLGECPTGTRAVYRVFSNRADANHRYMVDRSLRDQMTNMGWLAEGDGSDLVVMCVPQ